MCIISRTVQPCGQGRAGQGDANLFIHLFIYLKLKEEVETRPKSIKIFLWFLSSLLFIFSYHEHYKFIFDHLM